MRRISVRVLLSLFPDFQTLHLLLLSAVDENDDAVGFADDASKLTESLAHQPCLQAYMAVTHVTINFSLRNEGRYRINDNDADGA